MSEATVTAFRAPDDAQAGAFSDDRRPLSPTTQVAAIKGSFGKGTASFSPDSLERLTEHSHELSQPSDKHN